MSRCSWLLVGGSELGLCSRGTRVGPWPVRRMGWPTCTASSAGVMAVGDSTSQASTHAWPTMWTGSMTGSALPSGLWRPPEIPRRSFHTSLPCSQ
jgi:hypothetical protein